MKLNYNYITIVAAFLTLLSIIPKYYKVYKTKNVDSFSKKSIIIGYLASSLWLIHYLRVNDHFSTFKIVLYLILDAYLLFEIFKQQSNKPDLLRD